MRSELLKPQVTGHVGDGCHAMGNEKWNRNRRSRVQSRLRQSRGGYGAADLVPGEVDEEAGLGLQVLAAGEAHAVAEQLQRRVDEGQ